jgi:hypothetical protein
LCWQLVEQPNQYLSSIFNISFSLGHTKRYANQS